MLFQIDIKLDQIWAEACERLRVMLFQIDIKLTFSATLIR